MLTKKINYIVCDDEEIIVDAVFVRVKTIFKSFGVEASGIKTKSPVARKQYIEKSAEKEDIHLVFLDIEMPKLDGISLARVIKEKNKEIEVVFVSNQYEKVFETFGIHPFGFVRKDHFAEDLQNTIKEYIDSKLQEDAYFVVNTDNNSITRKLKIDDIVYIESYKTHQYIHMADGETLDVIMTMAELEKNLAEYDIIRVNKGCIVNLKYVQKIASDGVTLTEGYTTSLSRSKVQEIKGKYMEYLRKSRALVLGGK